MTLKLQEMYNIAIGPKPAFLLVAFGLKNNQQKIVIKSLNYVLSFVFINLASTLKELIVVILACASLCVHVSF